MALDLTVDSAFLKSDFLPPVCVFTGARDGVQRIPLPLAMPLGTLSFKPSLWIYATETGRARHWLLFKVLPPFIHLGLWLVLVGLYLAGLFLIRTYWLGPKYVPGCLSFMLLAATFPVGNVAALLLRKRLVRNMTSLRWEPQEKEITIGFSPELPDAFEAWNSAYQAWIAAAHPLPKRLDPEEKWADGRGADWDQSAGG